MKKDILKDLLAKPGKKQLVSDFDSSFTGDLSKQDAKEQLAKDIEKLSELQSMLYAQDRYSSNLLPRNWTTIISGVSIALSRKEGESAFSTVRTTKMC